jgi:glycosyltransferase involved in cell wall biosynthesis
VRLVGPQPYETLPGWAKAFDVAIIPYRLNQQVRNANPLKLREYLATGKPIVSVTNPEIEKFRDLVCLADGRESFLAGIDHALRNDTAELRRQRMNSVRTTSWEHRTQSSLQIVMDTLRRRQARTQ